MNNRDIDLPRGVAPERMPKADATGLAPEKSAYTTLRSLTVRRRVLLFALSPISLVKSRSGGLGHSNAKTARLILPGAQIPPFAAAISDADKQVSPIPTVAITPQTQRQN